MNTADQLRKDLLPAIEEYPGTTVWWTSRQSISSTRTGSLSWSRLASVRNRTTATALTGASPRIWRLFTITALDRVFTTTPPA